MVGSALVRKLKESHHIELITKERSELNLLSQTDVDHFFKNEMIDQIYLAAAKVGGVYANNTYPADFIYQNLIIECNIINSAHIHNINKLLFLGSSCIYPRDASQPMKEEALLTGLLENTNEPYAIAKIAGIKLCESFNRQHGRDYRSVMPTNLYGPNDNFHTDNSHVIPALIRRFHEAKIQNAETVMVWGSGSPMREFLYVDDMAEASIYIMNLPYDTYQKYTQPMLSHINVGTGEDCTIQELAATIASVIGFKGNIVFDSSKPDGAPRKLMNVSRLTNMGWRWSTPLYHGLSMTYDWFIKNQDNLRKQ